MSEHGEPVRRPDFRQGVAVAELADGAMLRGHVDNAPALLVRRGGDFLAIGATCTHYGGPLAEGLMVGDTIRCPWHHACFSLRTGAALRPPALNDLPCWRVEQQDGVAFVREELQRSAQPVAVRRKDSSVRRHRRRGCCWPCGRGDPAPGRFFRRGHPAECRPLTAMRPSQPVQGLPRRYGAARLDPAATARVLRPA